MSVIQSWLKCRTAEFTVRWGPSVALVTARGELDAANADQFADYVQHYVSDCRWLVLDLRGLEFIDTEGFSALHRINLGCSEADTPWAMVPSRALCRLLRICDPDGALPVAVPPNETETKSRAYSN